MAEFNVIDPVVGAVYEYESNRQLIRLQCVLGDPYYVCKGCYFVEFCQYMGHCMPTSRADKQNVIFKFLSAKYHLSEASKCYKITCGNPECGKEFWSEKVSRVYCCNACKNVVMRKRKKAKRMSNKLNVIWERNQQKQ